MSSKLLIALVAVTSLGAAFLPVTASAFESPAQPKSSSAFTPQLTMPLPGQCKSFQRKKRYEF